MNFNPTDHSQASPIKTADLNKAYQAARQEVQYKMQFNEIEVSKHKSEYKEQITTPDIIFETEVNFGIPKANITPNSIIQQPGHIFNVRTHKKNLSLNNNS